MNIPETLRNQKASSVSALPFDTLEYAKKLEGLGVEPENARAQSKLLANVIMGTVPTRQETWEQITLAETRLELKVVSIDTKIQNLYQEMQAEFKVVRQEMQAEFKAVRQEMQAEFKAVRQEMQTEFKLVRQEMHTEFKLVRQEIELKIIVIDTKIEGLRQEMQAEFKLVRKEMQDGISRLKIEMTRWYIGTSIGICGVMLSIAGYLSFLLKHG